MTMRRYAILAYGVLAYLMFQCVFLYSIGFIGNFMVPTTLDGPPRVSVGMAVLTDILLLTLFAVQHSGMARPTFKRWWTRFIPSALERSTYVIASNVVMLLMFRYWQPMGGVIWSVNNSVGQAVMYGVFACGWLLVFYSTHLLDHFELFGLRQVTLEFLGKPYTPHAFSEPGLYRYVRHPLYVGWLLVFWFTPTMTASHLFFAAMTTAYILVAIQLEERNLMDALPGYAEYRRRVPMLVPGRPSTSEHSASNPLAELFQSDTGRSGVSG